MAIWCPNCENWSALLPDGGQGIAAHAQCEHCNALMDAGNRYTLCPECKHYHRRDYEACPFHIEGLVIEGIVPASSGGGDGAEGRYAIVEKRRKSRRGDEYYWQLYMDYTAQPDASTSDASEEPPHPATLNGGNGSGNGHAHHVGNGSGNGNGAGNGHAAGVANGIDLAVAEAAPTSLFTDGEMNPTSPGGTAPKVASAGNYNDFQHELINDPSRLAQVAELLMQEKVLGVDTETTGLDPYTSEVLLLQLSTADRVYVVDCKRLPPLALKGVLEDPRILKLAHNAKFEYEMLRQQVGITLTGIFDTMLAERLLTAGISREISLKAIAQKYLGATLDKTVRETFYKSTQIGDAYLAPEQLHYAARDAFIMIPIWRDQVGRLKREGLEQVADLEFRCVAAVGDLELAGVQIDVARWRKIIEDVHVQRDLAASELIELLQPATMQATMFGVSAINLNSNTQLVEVLAKLGVELPDTMEATLQKFNHPAVSKLLEYRGYEKTLSAFGENVLSLINPKTGRIHPDFNQYGADTGRFSCLAGETLITTTQGLKRIDSVQVGDLVQTSFGPKRVLAAWCNGVRPIVRVTLSDGRVLRLTLDHTVLTGNGDTWRAVEELSVGDRMFLSLGSAEPGESEPAPHINIDPGTSHDTELRSIGTVTPIVVSGPKLYREAVSSGLITPSRKSVKPFIPLYKEHHLRTATLDELLNRWGDLPELRSARLYRQRNLHAVQIRSIEEDGAEPVYDLTVSDVNEFLANGLVVHNCTRPNVQQIPATSDFRKCFISAPGYKLITCDYSQCELRVLAELSGDEAFVNAFKSGQDLHTLTASQMFGVTVEEVQKPQRSAAKAINFGLAYGMGPGGLAPRLGVSLDEAKGLIARYFKAYPGIQKWLDKAAKDAVRLGYSATTLGRKRFYNIPSEELRRNSEDDWRKQIAAIERQGKNSPIQGANADMTKIALIYLRSDLRDWDARTVNTVHDEIVVEVREDQAEEVMRLVESAMVRAGQAILKEVPIVAEASMADYWSK